MKYFIFLLPVLALACTPKQLTHQRYWNHSFEQVNYIEFDSDTTFFFSYQNGLLMDTKQGVYVKEGQNYILNTLPDTTGVLHQISLKNTSASVKGNKLILENFISGQNYSEVLKRTKKKIQM